MTSTTALAERMAPAALVSAVTFTPEQVTLIKNTIAKGASDDELKLYEHIIATIEADKGASAAEEQDVI